MELSIAIHSSTHHYLVFCIVKIIILDYRDSVEDMVWCVSAPTVFLQYVGAVVDRIEEMAFDRGTPNTRDKERDVSDGE